LFLFDRIPLPLPCLYEKTTKRLFQMSTIVVGAWYSLTTEVSYRMPEYCVPPLHCGTNSPVWMNGSHPTGILLSDLFFLGWLGSRVVACWTQAHKAWVEIAVATLSGNSLRQTVHTHCACVHQAAKLIAALLRVAGLTAGLAESNGSLPLGL